MMFTLQRMAASYGQAVGDTMPCPTEEEFMPSCLVVDSVPLIHLDRREGSTMGAYSKDIGTEEKHWYKETYSHYWNEDHRSLCSIYEL